MLDTSDPKSAVIFAASRIEDDIRRCLVIWRDGCADAEADTLRAQIQNSLLPQLHELNARHFAAAAITQTLDALNKAVLSGDAVRSWEAFLDLAERPGANFGTWAI